jgi:hypothetical protein
MRTILAAAWLLPVPKPGRWDFTPVVCSGVLLVALRAAGLHLRWWGWIAAFAAGLPCATLASHFGLWALAAIAALVFLVALPAARAARRG